MGTQVGRGRLDGIEAARGVAALLVVLLHATSMMATNTGTDRLPFWGALLFGRAGVDFFFVLSGFIIAHVHAGDVGRPARLGLFWRKRLLRIYPTYWAVLALYGCLLAVSPTPDFSERDPWHILASITLAPEWRSYPIVGVAWTLRHELLFYGVFSLLILNRRLGWWVLAAWFAGIAFNMVWATATGAPYLRGVFGGIVFRVFNIEFLFGLAAAMALARGPARRPWAMLFWGCGIFLANGMAESFLPAVQHEWPPRHLLYGLGSALAIYGLASLDQARTLRVPRPLLVLGGASYSLYLVHTTILVVLVEIVRRMRPVLALPLEVSYLLMVAIAVAGGIVFSRLVEQPVMRLGNRLFVGERARRPIDAADGQQSAPRPGT